MRRLNKKKALNFVKELDAFPKVPESYVETTASGGTVSVLAFTAMALLAFFEFFVYRDTWMNYDKLRINIDITVAMRCQFVGADVLDLAETMVASDGLQYEPNRLREEHSLQDVLFKNVMKGAPTALPPREDDPTQPLNACRIHGHLYVNKVAGNFHITVGKAIPHPRGHAHLAALVSHESQFANKFCVSAYNFSHRIDHLSFGEEIPGILNPLDGTEKVSADPKRSISDEPDFLFLLDNQMFQYFITVVPTKLQTYKVSADTHQYSVTERERVINHAAGSHGVSGIFMKYDISSLMVKVTEQHMPLWQFLVRLCGIIGGIFSTTGMLHSLVGFCVDVVCCRFKLGVYKPKSMSVFDGHMNSLTPLLSENAEH
ncbi:endoplasmic reticulum-Golgi intermediate compartment 2 [Labeo rohita]|uniref:Endoplasmic reticulum-Golgi intermediate compartment protein n=1 Tax=Labeo rohita TaxID=84645 RepID=A0A498MYP6_LABRO|nr:endoplasmic reticulum-Golgi intermediate compartment 2 [Labeo rohita]